MSFSEVESVISETESKMGVPKYHFDREMVVAQKLAGKKDWKHFKEIFDRNKGKLLDPFDLFGNTALHAVARSGTRQLLHELLNKLNENEKKNALEKPNREGNTLLHEAVFNEDLKMVDVIMRFYPLHAMLEFRNESGETPVFRAARFGNLKILQHIHRKRPLESKHFQLVEKKDQHGKRYQKPYPILHACVLGLNFDVAIWLMEKVDGKLAEEKYVVNDNNNNVELTSLQLLSRMRMAFKSTNTLEMGLREDLIYKCTSLSSLT
ncbi:uncharacterized protein LOC133317994 [Gastrolobium bilobum]|uniref:uncharacterized protein LOC133317994 n=1 Tax=Gastrolobium bilobum TaxID=150636 RepID=UPI002AB19BEA|nr:uncharacterized protein LOC133317994 [Gastrolobium bilobum]